MLDIPEIEVVENHVEKPELPRLDIAGGKFYTSNGNVIELSNRHVSQLMLERVINTGKPKVPHVEITLMGKHKEIQENRNDPSYIQALKDWEGEQQLRILRYMFDIGVKGEPPEWFIDEQTDYFPDASRVDLKYLWVSSLVPDVDMEAFSDTLIGRFIATAKGLDESAKSFRSEDQRADTE